MLEAVFIVNPLSGATDKRNIVALIHKELDSSRFHSQIVYTQYPGHGRELARSCEADVVVAVGGDGTVSEVAQGIAGTRKALGIIPCGSGDGLALHLGISRNPRKAIRQLNRSDISVMDFGTVDGRPFFCTTGVGMDAQVAWEFARCGQRGFRTYIRKTLEVWRQYRPVPYLLEADGQKMSIKAMFITVANVNQWGNDAVIAPEASVTDGMLDVVILQPFHFWHIPGLAFRLFTRSFTRSSLVSTLRVKKLVLQREQPGPAHLDGDPVAMGARLSFEIHPAAVRILVPEGRNYHI